MLKANENKFPLLVEARNVDLKDDTVNRKREHLEIAQTAHVQAQNISTGLDKVRFKHIALPELCIDDIDLSTQFLGRKLELPFLVSSMTGGPARACEINLALARAANTVGIGLAVGSQRVALENNRECGGLDGSLREQAPDIPILANIGAAQLITWKNPVTMALQAVSMIDADALIVHLNPLQEVVQREGDRNWSGVQDRLRELATALTVPLVVKEVGCGLSGQVARKLVDCGAQVIDVAGAGGTSWAAIEAQRATNNSARRIAEAFHDWGIPTADCITSVRKVCPTTTIVASGGIRNGLDAARALRLGADMVGQAAGLLPAALDGPGALIDHFRVVEEQIRIACFCTSSASITELKSAELLPT